MSEDCTAQGQPSQSKRERRDILGCRIALCKVAPQNCVQTTSQSMVMSFLRIYLCTISVLTISKRYVTSTFAHSSQRVHVDCTSKSNGIRCSGVACDREVLTMCVSTNSSRSSGRPNTLMSCNARGKSPSRQIEGVSGSSECVRWVMSSSFSRKQVEGCTRESAARLYLISSLPPLPQSPIRRTFCPLWDCLGKKLERQTKTIPSASRRIQTSDDTV